MSLFIYRERITCKRWHFIQCAICSLSESTQWLLKLSLDEDCSKKPQSMYFSWNRESPKKHKNISQLDKTPYILQEFCQVVWLEKFAKITWSYDTLSLKTGRQGSRVMIVPDCSQFAGRSEQTCGLDAQLSVDNIRIWPQDFRHFGDSGRQCNRLNYLP